MLLKPCWVLLLAHQSPGAFGIGAASQSKTLLHTCFQPILTEPCAGRGRVVLFQILSIRETVILESQWGCLHSCQLSGLGNVRSGLEHQNPTPKGQSVGCGRWARERFWGATARSCQGWETCVVLEGTLVMSGNAGDKLHHSFVLAGQGSESQTMGSTLRSHLFWTCVCPAKHVILSCLHSFWFPLSH